MQESEEFQIKPDLTDLTFSSNVGSPTFWSQNIPLYFYLKQIAGAKPAFRLVVGLADFHFHISWKLHALLINMHRPHQHFELLILLAHPINP